jgi:putative flippase GtrA
MRRLVRYAWHHHRERILYLVVGGWNTLFQYSVFVACWFLLSKRMPAAVILLIAYLIASVNGFLGFRYIVFKPVRHPVIEFARYQVIYVPILILNMIGLPLLLKHTALNAYTIQALFVVFAVVAAYVGNKYFTFRRTPVPSTKRHIGNPKPRGD